MILIDRSIEKEWIRIHRKICLIPRGSLVPGPNVGYMPQELALYGEFTIKETFQYFGRSDSIQRMFCIWKYYRVQESLDE